jgi:malonyl CoA-acyl carrier protein transacylase
MRLAYAFLALIPIGKANSLFAKETGETHSFAEKIILNQIANWDQDYSSLPFLCHALLDAALNLRGLHAEKTIVDRFLESIKIFGQPATISILSNPAVDILGKPLPSKIGIHAFFPGMNSRRAYVNLPRDLYYDGAPEVKDIFEQSARILNYYTAEGELDVTPFFMEEKDVPFDVVAKWNHIGSAMTVYNLALFTHLKKANQHIHLHSVSGESFGMIAAAIVAGSLSLEDGLKVANTTLGAIYATAHSGNRDIWHIVSLRGKNLRHILTLLQMNFPDKIDVFRWHSINKECEEVHLYVHTDVFAELKESIHNYGNNLELSEFKKPTFEIIHSPKLFQARIDINHYLQREQIKFLDPQIPILSNNGTGLISKGEDIRQSILDMVNIPMYTAQTMCLLKNIRPGAIDAVIEIGYGQKTRTLIKDNQVTISFAEYFGDRYRLAAITRDLHKLRLDPLPNEEAQVL